MIIFGIKLNFMQQCQNHIPFAISAIFALVVKAVEGGNSQISL